MFSKPNGLGGNGIPYEGSYEIIPGTTNIIIPKNTVFKQPLVIKGNANLTSDNIKEGISIFNVSGNVIPAPLESYTWTEINEIVSQGLHQALFNLHDTKTFTVGSEVLTAEIADFDHDDKSDGTGKAGISFILKDCMNTKHNMNSTDTNVGGWTGSAMYAYLNTDIYNQLPSDLQSVIKPVNKITSKGNKSTELETSSDNLWLMSEIEIYGELHAIMSADGEGTQYPIFTDDASRIKKINGDNYNYWLRSPYYKNTGNFCDITSDGVNGAVYASGERGVAFGFCI